MRLWCWFCLLWLGFSSAEFAVAKPQDEAAQKKKLGDSLSVEGNYEEALQAYQEGKALNPLPEFDLSLAAVLMKLRRYEEAKQAYQDYLDSGKAPKNKATVLKTISEIEKILQTSITCTSNPPGATVYLNSRVDAPLGVTPLQENIAPGTHRLLFELRGYSPSVTTLTIEEGAQIKDCAASLSPAPIMVEIKSTPSEAEVFVGGASQGKTPMTVTLPSASEIELRYSTYQPLVKRFEGTSGDKLLWEASLVEIESGLFLESSPKDARLTIEGRDGEHPQGFSQLSPGVYQLRAKAPGYQEFTQEVRVAKGEQPRVSILMKPETGRLWVKAKVPNAKVLLDRALISAAAPIEVNAGARDLRVEAEGYSAYEQRITIPVEGMLSVDVSLEQSRRVGALLMTGSSVLGVVGAGLGFLVAASAREAFEGLPVNDQDDRRGPFKLRYQRALGFSGIAIGAAIPLGYIGITRYLRERPSTATLTLSPGDSR